MSSPKPHSPHVVRLVAALIVTIALFVLTTTAFSPLANAAVGDIKLSNPALTADRTPIQQWDQVTLSFDWAAPEGIKGGETFTAQFPKEVSAPNDLSFPLTDTSGNAGGTCKVRSTSQTITCTLNDAFANMDNVGGKVSVFVQAREITDQNQRTVNMTLGSEVVVVDIPGGEIVDAETPMIKESQKWGWAEENFTSFVWPVIIRGSDLAELGNAPLHIRDELGGNQVYADADSFSFYSLTASQFQDSPWTPPAKNHLAIDSVTISADGKSAEISISAPAGGWNPKRVYILWYRTATADGRPAKNAESFQNTAIVNGKAYSAKVVREVGGEGTITGVPRGSFDVTKVMEPGSEQLPADIAFKVQAVIDSPNDAFDGTKTYTVRPGETVNGGVLLPSGTTVTLKEVELPTFPGMAFNAPKFETISTGDGNASVSADGTTAVLTISEQTNVQLKLTNSVEPVVPPVTSTPTSTPTSAPISTPGTSSVAPTTSSMVTTSSTPTPTTTPLTAPPTTSHSGGIPLIPIPIPLPNNSGNSGGSNPARPDQPARPDEVRGIANPAPTAQRTHDVLGVSNPDPDKRMQQQPQRKLANTGVDAQWLLAGGTFLAMLGLGLFVGSRRT